MFILSRKTIFIVICDILCHIFCLLQFIHNNLGWLITERPHMSFKKSETDISLSRGLIVSMETNSFVINCGAKSETDSAGLSGISKAGYRAHKTTGLVRKEKETYIDDAFFVPHQQVPEEPGLIQIPQPDHVIHTLHRGGVHGLEGNLLTDLALLRASYHRINTTSSERNKQSPDGNSHLSFIVDQV